MDGLDNVELLRSVGISRNANYWLGFTDRDTEGEWRRVDGSVATNMRWNTNQPDNWARNEDCPKMLGGDDELRWNDLSCDNAEQYALCQTEGDVVTVQAISKGYELGDDAKFFVNGEEKRGITGRGYNFMVMNPVTKAVTTNVFDTWDNWGRQIPAMNRYIANIPLGSIVAVAVRDAHYDNGKAGSRSGLDSLGGGRAGCSYGRFRDAWAMITLKVATLDDLPPWFTCQHKPAGTVPATVAAVFSIAKPGFHTK